jgi:hypothetical protein
LEEDGQPRISVLIKDARPALSGGKESLFDIHYCAGSQGESYLVSELRVDLDAQGVSWRSGYNLRYELTWDDNRDHRFGPGDVLTVSERDWDEFGAEDVGTTWGVTLYRVPDMGFDELLAKADWAAR